MIYCQNSDILRKLSNFLDIISINRKFLIIEKLVEKLPTKGVDSIRLGITEPKDIETKAVEILQAANTKLHIIDQKIEELDRSQKTDNIIIIQNNTILEFLISQF